MSESIQKHYDDKYFSWQKPMGEVEGWANLPIFNSFILEDDIVLDFGCGGGYLLKNLKCKEKIGVEINSAAAEVARQNGVKIFPVVQEIPDGYIDIIISDNAIEHTLLPLQELMLLYSKLRKGGKAIIVVPCESISNAYKLNDINNHLYSWSPMSFGNLLIAAGFKLIESKAYFHRWPPSYRFFARIGGRKLFDLGCRIYGRLYRSTIQIRAVAEKPIT